MPSSGSPIKPGMTTVESTNYVLISETQAYMPESSFMNQCGMVHSILGC
jgi:hypothetical protein